MVNAVEVAFKDVVVDTRKRETPAAADPAMESRARGVEEAPMPMVPSPAILKRVLDAADTASKTLTAAPAVDVATTVRCANGLIADALDAPIANRAVESVHERLPDPANALPELN
jgi:hypothetical protein